MADTSDLKRKCLGFERELRAEFSPSDISMLRQDLRSMGMRTWLNWLDSHSAHIQSLASSGSSQRRAQLRGWSDAERRLLLLGALLATLEALRVFDVLEIAMFDQNAPARGLIPAASEAYHQIRFGDPPPYWPLGGEFPFDPES